MSLNRVYHPYWLWEDYKNGMWRKETTEYELLHMPDVISFTSNHMQYGEAMQMVIYEWPYTMEHNLTNKSLNRKAFVGHCACCFKHGWPEYLVRLAWKHLTDKQRYLANCQAELAIKKWEQHYDRKNKPIHKDMGSQMLLEWVAR